MTFCDLCEVPAVVSEKEMLLDSGVKKQKQKNMLGTRQVTEIRSVFALLK